MRVLLIEDSPTSQMTFRQAIEMCPQDVVLDCLESFQQGMEIAHEYEAIVIDLSLPDIEICTANLDEVVSQIPDVPCIAFTGNEDISLAYQLGLRGIGFIAKSTEHHPLVYEIANQIGQFERHQELRAEIRALKRGD